MNLKGRLIPNSARSGIIAQIVVLAICMGLIISNRLNDGNAGRLLPLAIVGLNAVFCFFFWKVRLKNLRSGSRGKLVVTVGFLAMGTAYTGLLLLVILLVSLSLKPDLLRELGVNAEPGLYLLCVWAILEIIHHHISKLLYGKRDTLEYIIRAGHWQDLRAPLGGAIGVQIRKLNSERYHSKKSRNVR